MRKLTKLVSTAIVISGLTMASTLANAADFKFGRFFVLGDSLSDAGAYSNFAKFALGTVLGPANVPDIEYKFTENSANAKVWAQFLGDKMNIDMGPDVIRGIFGGPDTELNGGIYAEGGSRVSNPIGSGHDTTTGINITTIPVTQQVQELLADVGGQFRDNDLVALWAGANDAFQNIGNPNVAAELTLAASQFADAIQTLKDAGAKNVLVFTIPTDSLGISPFNPLFNIFNNAMKASVADKDVLVIDFQKLIDAAYLDPTRFGYTSPNALTGVSCQPPGSSSLTCLDGVNTAPDGTYLLADQVHPSQTTHSNFADVIFATLRAATQNAAMSESTLSSLRQHGISTENRMSLDAFLAKDGTRRKTGDVKQYGSIEGGYFESDSGQIDPGSQRTNEVVRIGADTMLGANTLAGVSFSVDHGQLDFDNNAGGFDSRMFVGSVYGSVALSKYAYVNASVGLGYVDFYDINRRFNIGPSQESYSGETNGLYRSAKAGGGLVLPLGNWRINPSASVSYELINIDGYTESSGVASLSYGDNELESLRLSGGVTLTYIPEDPNGWKPSLRASIEHELNDDDIVMNMGMDTNSLGKLFLPRSGGTFGYVSGGLSRSFGENSEFGVNASALIGKDGETGITGGVSFKTRF